MTERVRRQTMSAEARAELVAAVESESIRNAAAFAEEFAARHGLNPVSIQSAISRLRRERGLLVQRLEITLGSAAAIIAQESPEAAGLMLDLLELNRDSTDDLMRQLYEAERGRVAELEAEVARLRGQLALIAHRHDFMLGLVHEPFPVELA